MDLRPFPLVLALFLVNPGCLESLDDIGDDDAADDDSSGVPADDDTGDDDTGDDDTADDDSSGADDDTGDDDSPPVAVTAAGRYGCVLRESGEVDCWGFNAYGTGITPEAVMVQIDSSIYHSCGLDENDEIQCWGCGDGQDFEQCDAPTGGSYLQAVTGGYHACALDTATRVPECWGCLGHDDGQCTPREGMLTQIAAGLKHSCGIRTDSTVDCWGDNLHGQLDEPVAEMLQIASNYDHSCGIDVDGNAHCWGCDDNDHGQCTVPAGTFTDISTGQYHSCAVATDDSIVCWGCSTHDNGQCTVPSGEYVDVATGGMHTCALTSTLEIVCWGSNDDGQCDGP